MAIKYLPDEMLRKIAPKKKVDKLVSGQLTLNRAVLSFLDDADFIDKVEVKDVALKTIKEYKQKYKEERKEGSSVKEAFDDATNDNKLLINRVQNTVVYQVTQGIREKYWGEKFKWLPSDAAVPDPLHQLNYGKIFTIGADELPGDRYGCQCGMLIMVTETQLKL